MSIKTAKWRRGETQNWEKQKANLEANLGSAKRREENANAGSEATGSVLQIETRNLKLETRENIAATRSEENKDLSACLRASLTHRQACKTYAQAGKEMRSIFGQRERGVMSLVEIIIIVIILGILVSASVISYMGARDRALIRQSCAMFNDVRQALSVYYADTGTYPSGATSFSNLYTVLSASGLEVDPSSDFYSFENYTWSNIDAYTLVARAKDRQHIPLTANPDVIDAHSASEDFGNVCNR